MQQSSSPAAVRVSQAEGCRPRKRSPSREQARCLPWSPKEAVLVRRRKTAVGRGGFEPFLGKSLRVSEAAAWLL